jgi:hypothetical protein
LLGLRYRELSVDFEGRFDVPFEGAGEDPYRVPIRMIFGAGSFVPCGHSQYFFGCAVLSVGAMVPKVNLGGAARAVLPYLGAGLRGGGTYRVHQNVELFAYAEGLVTAIGPIMVGTSAGPGPARDVVVWEMPWVTGAVSIGALVEVDPVAWLRKRRTREAPRTVASR